MKHRILIGALCFALWNIALPTWAKTFTVKDLKGNYVLRFTGSAGVAANPFPNGTSLPETGSGVETADGKGNFTATTVFSIGGTTCSGTIAGTYSVNPNGTGTSKGTFTPNATAPSGIPAGNYGCPPQITGEQNEAFTIGKNGVTFISTDPDSVISGLAQRQ